MERIDDLQCKGYKIIQDTEGFCFGMDSVLLSDFAKEIKKKSKVIDLGTGNGILGILLCAKTELEKIIGIEIQKESFELANKNIIYNNLEKRFEVINVDVKEISKVLERGIFDVVVSNPPYKKENTGLKNEEKRKTIARHEIMGSLDDFLKATSYLLKDKGVLYLVHRPNRLVDICSTLRKNHLEPKRMKFVYPKIDKEPNLILIKAVKNAKPELRIEKPLIVYKESGEYTDEIMKIYNKGD